MSSLPTRQLGRDGPHVTALGLGLMGLSFAYGPKLPDVQRHALLSHAYSSGAHFWDSADAYDDNEDLLSAWFAANPSARQHIFLATKFAQSKLQDGARTIDSSPEYARQACEKSLKRLGVECIDLYYCHRLDGKTPVEKTVQAMAQLKSEGKIRYLGLSECSAESLRRACKVHHITAVQIEYSPFSLEIESPQIKLLQTARELGVAIVAYSPIGRGILTGTIRSPSDFGEGDLRAIFPRFSPENFPSNLALADTIGAIARRKNVAASQLTLAWLLAQGDDIVPIPGTTKPARLDENLGALKVVLTKEEIAEIREASERAEVKGERYPEGMVKALFADTPAL